MPLFTVTAVSPDRGPSSGGFKIFVRGTGFESGLDLKVGNLSCSDILISQGGTLVSATVPPQAPGVYDVTVFNSLTNFKTMSNAFTYTQVVSLGGLVQTTPSSVPPKVGGAVQTTAVTISSSPGSPAIQILGVPGGPPVITADISRDTFDPNKNYDKLLFQQGRPLLDAELNELQDIDRGKFVDTVQGAIGNGPFGDGFKVEENTADPTNKLLVRKGTFFHEGAIVNLHSDFILSGLTTPVVDREDTVYCVYCFEEIDSTEDPNIKDVSVGVETARRIKISVQIFIAEGSLLSIPPAGCKAFPLAQIHRHATCAFIREICPCCTTDPPFPDCAPCTPCHTEGDIVDLRITANQNYCVEGIDITATGGFGFSWTAGRVIANNQFVDVAASSGSVPPSSVIYLYVDQFGNVLQSGTIPAVPHVLKSKITSDGAGIVEMEDQCIYLPRTGLHDHNSPEYHLNLQGGDVPNSELYHMTALQWTDLTNGDGGVTNVADQWHKHGLAGVVLSEFDDRYVNITGDTMTGDLIMAPSLISATLIGTVQEPFDIVGAFNDQFIISVDGSGPDVVFLTAGILKTAQQISDNLNTLFANHIPQINASVSILSGRLVVSSFSVGSTSTLAISGNAADNLGFGLGNNTAAGFDAPAIRSNFVTFDKDSGLETPRVGAFFVESNLAHPIGLDRPAMDIVGAGGVIGGPGRLVRIFDDLNVYGNLHVAGDLFVDGEGLHHNALEGIQGGTLGPVTNGDNLNPDDDERYHLTQAQWEFLIATPFMAAAPGSPADQLHTHTLFSDVRLYASPVATRGNPHIQAAINSLGGTSTDLGEICGVVADSLYIVGAGNAPDRAIILWDDIFVVRNVCWAGVATGHIAPVAGFTFDVDIGNPLKINFHAMGPFSGLVQLGAGSAVVNSLVVTDVSQIHLTAQDATGAAPGEIYVSARTANTSFTITSTNGADTRHVAWFIQNPQGYDVDVSSPGDSPLVAFTWDYGDGSASDLVFVPDTSHTYALDGTYTVRLVVHNQHQHISAPKFKDVQTGGIVGTCVGTPTAAFTFTADLVADPTGHTFDFDGTTSTAGGAGCLITDYTWDISAGIQLHGPIVNNFYLPSDWTVRLTVTNNALNSDFVDHLVTVGIGGADAPVASFTLAPIDSGDNYLAQEPYTLTSTATGGSGNYNYEWDLHYTGIFHVDRTTSTVTGSMPVITGNRTFAFRVFDTVRNVYSNVATKVLHIFDSPKLASQPTYVGGYTGGQFLGGGGRHAELIGSPPLGPWAVTIQNSSIFSLGWTATWSDVTGNPTPIDNSSKYGFIQNSNLQGTISIPGTGSPSQALTADLNPFYINLRVRVSKAGRAFQRDLIIHIPIMIFTEVTSSHTPNGDSGSITLSIAGKNLNLGNHGTFKVYHDIGGGGYDSSHIDCPSGGLTSLDLPSVTWTNDSVTATVNVGGIGSGSMCCYHGNNYRVIFLDIAYGNVGAGDLNEKGIGFDDEIMVRFPSRTC